MPKKKLQLFSFAPADPYNYDRLYYDEKYSLSNMTLVAVNFPAEAEFGFDVWDDRLYTEWRKAIELVESTTNDDAFFAGATPKSLLAFANAMAKACNFPHKVTGARVVRFTNLSTGYPTLRLDCAAGQFKFKRKVQKFRFGGRDE